MGHGDEDDVEATILGSEHDVFQGNELLHIAATVPSADIDGVRERVSEMDNFRGLAADALNILERHHHTTLAANGQSQAAFHQACQATREILGKMLDRDLEWKHQKYVIDQLVKLVQMEGAKDSESKRMLSDLSKKQSTKLMVMSSVAVAGITALAIVGPKAIRQFGEALRRG